MSESPFRPGPPFGAGHAGDGKQWRGDGGDAWTEELSAPGDFTIRASRDEGTLVLALYGELDMATADTLTRKLDMVGSLPPARVVVDLSGLQFLDSTGLHALISVHREWSTAERSFKLIRGPRAVQRVFELTETEALFEFED